MRERGHSQAIASPIRSELERRAREEGFEIAALSWAELRAWASRVDVFHSHTGRAQNIAWLASIGAKVTRIATRHVAFKPMSPRIHRWKYEKTCDGVIAVSQAVRQTLLDTGVPSERIETIPTGVEIPTALPSADERAAARQIWNLTANDFVVGHLGAFTHEKGQDVAVAAARLLETRLPSLKMILAGKGHLQKDIPSNDRLILPGHLEDPRPLLTALDLFIMPSRSEGWGLAALEAMAMGLPVIASNTGGLAEMIVDRETGSLVPPGDAAALAEAIFEAASNHDRTREIGLRAREASRKFSVEQTAARTEAFYSRVLASRAHAEA